MFQIKTLNNIAARGLSEFPSDKYNVSGETLNPDAILVRSYDMHAFKFPDSVQVVGRAGAGTNNIPVANLTQAGIPVLNTPGANANAVKELVLASMLLVSRSLCHAWNYVRGLSISDSDELHHHIENTKKQFVGSELPGKTLGIIGLGNIGVKLANAAHHLGMHVIGFDADITVRNAWQLSSSIERAENLEQLLQSADYISLHIPLTSHTRHFIDAKKLALFKKGAILLNFARDGIVDNQALLQALTDQKIRNYVCDFPDILLKDHPQVISLPHLGASTYEAEENCAVMVAQQVKAYLEMGHIINAVNFPDVRMPRIYGSGHRLAVINANVPNMLAQISTALSNAGVNIVDMINKSQAEIAYTLVDVNAEINDKILNDIRSITGVIRARCI